MRRRLRRRRIAIACAVLLIILLGAFIYGLQQSAVRISSVQIYGADESLSSYATLAMQGSYLGIIPRDSIFFFPSGCIRSNIIREHPEIAAVSIFRNSPTSISIKMDNRVPIARWCGATSSGINATSSSSDLVAAEDCYFFDAKGFIYATTSPSQPINPFVVHEPISNEINPIGSTLPNANEFPSAFDFARELSKLGSPVINITFRGDEIDDHLASGTRVTYVLGDEQNAFTALVSARDDLNLSDGSVEYVDLRFSGKIYTKKK